jgi:hypothetical protein
LAEWKIQLREADIEIDNEPAYFGFRKIRSKIRSDFFEMEEILKSEK